MRKARWLCVCLALVLVGSVCCAQAEKEDNGYTNLDGHYIGSSSVYYGHTGEKESLREGLDTHRYIQKIGSMASDNFDPALYPKEWELYQISFGPSEILLSHIVRFMFDTKRNIAWAVYEYVNIQGKRKRIVKRTKRSMMSSQQLFFSVNFKKLERDQESDTVSNAIGIRAESIINGEYECLSIDFLSEATPVWRNTCRHALEYFLPETDEMMHYFFLREGI